MYLISQVKFESKKPHSQPLSDGEGRKIGSNAPLSIGEGLGVRFCDIKYILQFKHTKQKAIYENSD
jgi:hypothetical protein